jgi:putative restriction endonuclease
MHYVKCVECIRQKRINGEIIVAKPVLLVAIVDSIDANVFTNKKFVLNDWLEERYKKLTEQFTMNSQFDGTTGIENPFWHLETDGFWHLTCQSERLSKGLTPSKAWLKDNVEFAYFDEPLWIMLQNKVWRTKFREYIIEHKLTDGFWSGKLAAEGFGVLVAILFAA